MANKNSIQEESEKLHGNSEDDEDKMLREHRIKIDSKLRDKKTTGGKLKNAALKSHDSDYELVPPDGGWGWLVLLGATLVNILIPGTIKSFGVLFVEFLDAFQASPAAAAWIPALCYFLYSSLGPLSSILSVKYSYRTVTLLGGTSAALGMMLSFWASSVPYLYLSYGILVGIGAGLSFPPTVYIVTSYFLRLRGLANGLCISGSALGSIILPPLLRVLLENYGYRGSVLIMGAVTLNVWVAALFYEPVEKHLIRVPKKKHMLENIEEEDIGIVMKLEIDNGDIGSAGGGIGSDEKSLFISSEERLKYDPKDDKISNMSPQFPTNNSLVSEVNGIDTVGNGNFTRSVSAAVVQNLNRNVDENNRHILEHQRTRKISTPIRIPQRNQTFTTGQLSSTPSLYAVPEAGLANNKLDRSGILRNSKMRLPKKSPSTSSFQYISTPYHGSTLSFQPKEFSSRLSLRSVASGKPEKDEKFIDGGGDEEKTMSQKFFDLSLLKDPVYLIILISNSTNAISYTNFIILLPAYAIDLNFDKSLAAYLISIVSTTDLIGRIGGSALSDMNLIPKTWYFVGGLALSGVSLALLPISKTYGMISLACAVFGLASGTYVGITAVIMADMIGEKRLTSSYGISLFINGILQLIGPPLCGVWYESVKSYVPLFTTLGVILLAGAALWGLMPFIKKEKNSTTTNGDTKERKNLTTNNASDAENHLLEKL